MNNNNLLFTCRKIVESHREKLLPSTTMNIPMSSLQTLSEEEKWLSGDDYKKSNIEYIDAYLLSKSCNDSILPDNWHCISNTTKCYLSPKVRATNNIFVRLLKSYINIMALLNYKPYFLVSISRQAMSHTSSFLPMKQPILPGVLGS